MKTKIFFLMLFVGCAAANGQTPQEIDSLLQHSIYKKELQHEAQKALEMSEEIQYLQGIMSALDQLGVMERNNSFYAQSLVYHKRCFDLAQQHNDDHWLMRSCINLGVIYNRMDEYATALDFFFKAMPLAEKLENDREIASCFGNIGNLYLSLNKYDEAMIYFRKSFAKAEKTNNYQGFAISYGSMGRVYEKRNMLDSALYCYEKNLFYSKGWNDNNGIAIVYTSMGNVAKKKNEWKKAENFYNEALKINQIINDRKYLAPNYANLGEVDLHLGKLENAEKNYKKALQTATDAALKNNMAEAYNGLSKVYEKQNREKEAIAAIRHYVDLKDSVLNEKNLQQIEFLKISFDVAQKELEISNLQANSQLRLKLMIVGGIILFAVIMLLLYIVSLRNRRNRILAEMNATKDKFFSIISHDLKNPAIAQRDALQLLAEHAADQLDKKSLETYYSELLKSAENQVKLLYNLLNWAQVQTGRIACTPVLMNLTEDLWADILLIKNQAESKGITFTAEMPAEILVTGDSDMLVTVVRNLLTNAVKFTREGGNVILKIENTEGKTIISVQDTGTGMSEETLRHLFQVDRQHAQRGTAGETGSGLGLIVCKEFLGMHGSALHVESQVNEGSRFWFEI